MEVIKDCKDEKAIAGISRILRCMTKILECSHKLGYGRSMLIFTDMWAVSTQTSLRPMRWEIATHDAFWTQATANLSRAEVHPLKPFLARFS